MIRPMRRTLLSTDRTGLAALVVMTILVRLGGTTAGLAESNDAEALQTRVDQLAEEALKESGAVGLSVAVALNDELLLEQGYGKIELEHDVAADADSVFRIGSITKQFTAAAVMKLIEQGASRDGRKLSLDAPISDFLDFPTGGRVVTVRHLLTHTSGIKSYTGLGAEWVKTIPLEMSHQELLALVKDKEFDFEPNTEYRYNNSGYYLLGVLIEEVSGQTYAEYLRTTFFEPLGLHHLRYGSNSDIIPNRAQGYTRREGVIVNDGLIGMSQPGAAGALLSNAGDLVRWSLALVSGKVVGEDSYRQMTTAHVLENGESTNYGFGLGIDSMDEFARISHGGGINGFNSMLVRFPEEKVTVAVISNSEAYRSGQLAKKIARAALGVEEALADLEISASELERAEGTYALSGVALELRVFARDGQLFSQATGQPEFRLLLQGVESGVAEYRPSFDTGVKLFVQAGSPAPGVTLHQGGAVTEGARRE